MTFTVSLMAYKSEETYEMRRCKGTKKSGLPCRNYAVWGDALCINHGGVKTSRRPVCHCEAYEWPHALCGGLCRWPEPPRARCTTPAGTRKEIPAHLAMFKGLRFWWLCKVLEERRNERRKKISLL